MLYEVEVNIAARGEDIDPDGQVLKVKVKVEADDVEDAELLAEDLVLDSVYVGSKNAKLVEN